MKKALEIRAVNTKGLTDLLIDSGYHVRILAGDIKCRCGTTINLSNIGAVFTTANGLDICCDALDCLTYFTNKDAR